MSDATEVLLEIGSRASARWRDAVGKIRQSKYGLGDWLSDAVGFWVDDVAGAFLQAGGTSPIIFFSCGHGEIPPDSSPIAVDNPKATELSHLSQVGGTRVIVRDPPDDTYLALCKPDSTTPSPRGTVVISFRELPEDVRTGDQYLGLLFEGQKVLAQVVLLIR